MARTAFNLLLLTLLVYAGVSIWYARLEERLAVQVSSPEEIVRQEPERVKDVLRKPDDYTIIVRRNIFQAVIVKKEEASSQEEAEQLEPTKLKLSLMGTISGDENDARAIISDDAKRQQDIYQVGDSIQGAMIKTISRGEVVLEVNGNNEVLTLKDREGGGPAYTPSATDYYREPVVQQQVGIQEQGTARNRAGRRPVVRPRPINRPPTTDTLRAEQQPDIEGGELVPPGLGENELLPTGQEQ